MDMKTEVEQYMEKLKNKPLAMQYRDFAVLEDAYDLMKENTRLTDLAKGTYKPAQKSFELVVKFDKDNAIVKDTSRKPSSEDALYTIVCEGETTNRYYETLDEALLGYLGRKNLGPNSQFAELTYKMLK